MTLAEDLTSRIKHAIVVDVLFTVEDSFDMGITTPSPMLSALPDSPSPTGFNDTITSQSMWSEEVEYVELEKQDGGLGFSILDYKVSCCFNSQKKLISCWMYMLHCCIDSHKKDMLGQCCVDLNPFNLSVMLCDSPLLSL